MTEFVLHSQLEQDSAFVADLTLCSVRLINDANYPWLILVPRVKDIAEIIDLPEQQQRQLWEESGVISRVLTQLFTPDKLNVAALGNMVPQLHIHHIARYKDDVAWPNPIWGQVPAKAYTEDKLAELIKSLKIALEARSSK